MSSYQYTPPYGFGGDVPTTQKKKDPYGTDTSGGSGAATGAVGGSSPMPGQGYVGTYASQTAGPQGVDLMGQTTQLLSGSRDAALESDAPYMQLLARLGLDEKNARDNMVHMQGVLGNNLTDAKLDLTRQSQEDKHGIDARLRARGVGRSSQREALQLRADQNMARASTNLEKQSADQYAQLEQGFTDKQSSLARERIQGTTDASGRLQTQRDAIQNRLDAQRWQDEQLRQSATNNQLLIDAMNRGTQANQPQQQQQVSSTVQEPSFADKLAMMSPEERRAWDAFIGASGGAQPAAAAPPAQLGGGGGYSAPAQQQQQAQQGWPYRQNLPAIKAPAPPKQQTIPHQGYY